MPKYQAVRGTHDILPADAAFFDHLETVARRLFQRFGYHEIRTPTFESLDLFHRSLGETTDVVEKEMYAFEDRGGRKLALRPEGTAGVVRAYVEHHLDQTGPFCKLFYMGPMFRAERPQAGRYREFWQIGAESFGNASPTADAELLILVHTLFKEVKLTEIQLKLNSLGDETCRPLYRRALIDFLEYEKPHLCEDCLRRIHQNPLRALDCKKDAPRLSALPTIDSFWCEECRNHFKTVCRLLEKTGTPFVLAPRLVRGLDYYTRTVFEASASLVGAQDALAAGGRYDRLVKQIGGPDMPALGFALGSERTIETMQAMTVKEGAAELPIKISLFVAAVGDTTLGEAFQLLQELRMSEELRRRNIDVEGGFFEKKLGSQLTIANRLGATHCIILGEEELERAEVTVRSLKASSQLRMQRKDFVRHFLELI